MGSLRGSEWLILVLIVILLFGAKKLPEAARGLGRSLRIFKSEVTTKDESADEVEPHGSTAVTEAPPAAITQTSVPSPIAPAQPYLPPVNQAPAQAYVPAPVVQSAPVTADSTDVQSVSERFYGEERSDR